jgi:hypothetical protein
MVAFNQNRLVAASCPGGMAAQYRVQVASNDCAAPWKLVAAFRKRTDAAHCQAQLSAAGHRVRIIACQSLPTAA